MGKVVWVGAVAGVATSHTAVGAVTIGSPAASTMTVVAVPNSAASQGPRGMMTTPSGVVDHPCTKTPGGSNDCQSMIGTTRTTTRTPLSDAAIDAVITPTDSTPGSAANARVSIGTRTVSHSTPSVELLTATSALRPSIDDNAGAVPSAKNRPPCSARPNPETGGGVLTGCQRKASSDRQSIGA